LETKLEPKGFVHEEGHFCQ